MSEKLREYAQFEETDIGEDLSHDSYLNSVPVMPEEEISLLVELAQSGVDLTVCRDEYCLVPQELKNGDVVLFAETSAERELRMREREKINAFEEIVQDNESIKDEDVRRLALPVIQETWKMIYERGGLSDEEIEKFVGQIPSLSRNQLLHLAGIAYEYRESMKKQKEESQTI